MKNGNVQKLPNGEIKVVLTENDVVVCETYVSDDFNGKEIVENWKNGTYKLLTE